LELATIVFFGLALSHSSAVPQMRQDKLIVVPQEIATVTQSTPLMLTDQRQRRIFEAQESLLSHLKRQREGQLKVTVHKNRGTYMRLT
jgi:hypothetical protein